MITIKIDSVKIFDITKIGVGDIIEYDQSLMATWKKRRVAGIVTEVKRDYIEICERDCFAPFESTRKFGFPIERAAEIKIIYRHPDHL